MGTVQVARNSDLTEGEATDKLRRRLGEVDDLATVDEAHTGPDSRSGWHHHGENTAYVYVLQGQLRIEWGPGGGESADLAAGDFYLIPPKTVHREANPGSEEQILIAFFVGSGPVVGNVDGPESQ